MRVFTIYLTFGLFIFFKKKEKIAKRKRKFFSFFWFVSGKQKFLPSIPKIDPKIKILIEFWQNLAARTAFIFLRVIEMFVLNDDKKNHA
jgi:hypothetical protein